MRLARAYGFAGFAILAVTAAVIAQPTVAPLPETAPAEAVPLDAAAAAELAGAKGGDATAGAAKAAACAACHGLDGNATDPTLYPRLAGQSERYIARQLSLFKSGERVNAIMQPFAMTLSAQDMRDIGAHYAQQKGGAGVADDAAITTADSPYKGMKFYQVGEKLYRSGDAARGVPACMACHGPSGAGNPGPAYPRVAGQQSWFVARRLQEYRAGTTTEKDRALFDVMSAVAKPLTDEEIQALSSYLQGLHDRRDEAPAGQVAAGAQAPAAGG
ncbi:MAG: c-type cytochrome [Lysobacteraceae bacterium]|nr:MAG: c-type cytochrome [Xanthomonadaceae bacterium]